MLRLDDELAGLVEAADMPVAQAGAHTTKPEPVSPVPGQLAVAHSMSAAALSGTQQTQARLAKHRAEQVRHDPTMLHKHMLSPCVGALT